ILSCLTFDYFFVPPLYSLAVTRQDLPYFISFAAFAFLVTWFASVRRRVERDLLRSQEELRREVEVRSQQASLLNLTHDSIFVRDMNFNITYWNRGAQELYGWTPEQAIGKHSQQLLGPVCHTPLDEILAALLPPSRWEGEVLRTTADGSKVVVA